MPFTTASICFYAINATCDVPVIHGRLHCFASTISRIQALNTVPTRAVSVTANFAGTQLSKLVVVVALFHPL